VLIAIYVNLYFMGVVKGGGSVKWQPCGYRDMQKITWQRRMIHLGLYQVGCPPPTHPLIFYNE